MLSRHRGAGAWATARRDAEGAAPGENPLAGARAGGPRGAGGWPSRGRGGWSGGAGVLEDFADVVERRRVAM
jgi:hypothetical protein